MSFNTVIKSLNKSVPYRFFNRGLVSGIICKINLNTDERTYYTSDYKVFRGDYSAAKIHQRIVNMKAA